MARIFNIFHNDFYERPVLPNWSWELVIFSNPIEGWTEQQLSNFTKAVTKCDIPELQMLTVQSQYRGMTFDIPTRIENTGTITLTFNENSDLTLYKDLKEKLYYTSYNENYIIDEWSKVDDNGKYIDTYMLYYAPFDVCIKMMDPTELDSPVYYFIFRNCFISEIGDVELSYDSDEAYTYSVKINYNFRIEGVDAEEYFNKLKDIQSNSTKSATEDIDNEEIDPPVVDPSENIPQVPSETPEQTPNSDSLENTQSAKRNTEVETADNKPRPAAYGVDNGAQVKDMSPQDRARNEAAEAMTGYRPNPTTGVEHMPEDANRSYSHIHDAEYGHASDTQFTDGVDNTSDLTLNDVIIKADATHKWTQDIAKDDFALFINSNDISDENQAALDELAAMDLNEDADLEEYRTRARKVTDSWRNDSNESDLDILRNTKLEPPPRDSEIVAGAWREEMNSEDLNTLANSLSQLDLGATATDHAKSKPAEKPKTEKLAEVQSRAQKSVEDDEKNDIIRIPRELASSSAERTKIESEYAADGKKVIWY